TIIFRGGGIRVSPDGIGRVLKGHDPVGHAQDAGGAHGGGGTAAMGGKVIAIAVGPGDAGRRGQTRRVMEAMKMEHAIMAPTDGTVEEIFFEVGDQVADGAELASLTD